jgi:predicted esterase
MALPGVLGVSIRGPSPVPPALLGADLGSATRHFHWGDDITLATGTGELDPDPGFEKAERLIMDKLVGDVLVDRCGWEPEDLLLFGFGQGGALALGLASKLRMGKRVEDVGEDTQSKDKLKGRTFKGVVSIGGALPMSMVPSVSSRDKAHTPVLLCHGSSSEIIDEDAVDSIKKEFTNVKIVQWKRPDDGMPRNREEVLPMMEFFADRLRSIYGRR